MPARTAKTFVQMLAPPCRGWLGHWNATVFAPPPTGRLQTPQGSGSAPVASRAHRPDPGPCRATCASPPARSRPGSRTRRRPSTYRVAHPTPKVLLLKTPALGGAYDGARGAGCRHLAPAAPRVRQQLRARRTGLLPRALMRETPTRPPAAGTDAARAAPARPRAATPRAATPRAGIKSSLARAPMRA